MRERLGMAMQLAGLILMPVAVWQGANEVWSFGTEIAVGALGFLLFFVGRGLRGGQPRK
jgi:hypothetical protein